MTVLDKRKIIRYNIKRIGRRLVSLCAIFVALVFLLSCAEPDPTECDCGDGSGDTVFISLTLVALDQNSLTVSVSDANGIGICALMMELFYPPSLALSYAEPAGLPESFALSLCDTGESVRFVLDGAENSPCLPCELLRFTFERKELSAELDFSLVPVGKVSACRYSRGEAVISAVLGDTAHFDICSAPESFLECGADIGAGGKLTLMYRGETGFAAGFEVVVADVSGGEVYSLVLSRALSPSDVEAARRGTLTLELSLPLPTAPELYVIARPLIWSRGELRRGERKTYFLSLGG